MWVKALSFNIFKVVGIAECPYKKEVSPRWCFQTICIWWDAFNR